MKSAQIITKKEFINKIFFINNTLKQIEFCKKQIGKFNPFVKNTDDFNDLFDSYDIFTAKFKNVNNFENTATFFNYLKNFNELYKTFYKTLSLDILNKNIKKNSFQKQFIENYNYFLNEQPKKPTLKQNLNFAKVYKNMVSYSEYVKKIILEKQNKNLKTLDNSYENKIKNNSKTKKQEQTKQTI